MRAWTKADYVAAQHKYFVKNRDKVNARCCELRKRPSYRFNYARHFAARHSRPFTLSKPQYSWLISHPCHYCNKSLFGEKGCGLDRKNNAGGYTPDNVLPCCGDCNGIRNDILSVAEMRFIMLQLLDYRRTS